MNANSLRSFAVRRPLLILSALSVLLQISIAGVYALESTTDIKANPFHPGWHAANAYTQWGSTGTLSATTSTPIAAAPFPGSPSSAAPGTVAPQIEPSSSSPAVTTAPATITAGSKAAASAQPGKTLQGSAQVVVLTLSDLRDVGLDLKHLQNAANHLNEEVTLQRVTLNMMPEMVGPGMIINIPIGTTPTGEVIPANPKRVQAAMAQLSPIVTLMKGDVDAFVSGEKQLSMPGDTQQELQGELKQWAELVSDVYQQFSTLQPLTQQSPYNQPAIAQASSTIVNDAKGLERLRRLVYKALQREGKRIDRAEKHRK